MCQRNKVNWAKNDRGRAIYGEEVKIPEILKLQFSTFWRKNFFPRYEPNFGGIDPIFFCCHIIAYILGSYHALPLNPDFWVDLRGVMIMPPSLRVK